MVRRLVSAGESSGGRENTLQEYRKVAAKSPPGVFPLAWTDFDSMLSSTRLTICKLGENQTFHLDNDPS